MKLTQLNNEQLVDKCRECNQNAQLEIYNRYYKAMYNASFRIVRDTAEAEDIMQAAFLTAFTKLSMLKDNKMFGSWLKRIVINSSLTATRKRNNFNEIPLEAVDYGLSEREDGVAQEDLSNVKANMVMSTLTQLKESYSTVLSLHLIEGYDYEEICEILNISSANCRTLISRAKESLRKKIQFA